MTEPILSCNKSYSSRGYITDWRYMCDVKEMYRKVKERLPNFDSGNTARQGEK